MDKQPLNTAEQKDMTEFFTDLIGKIEEMSPALVLKCFVQLFPPILIVYQHNLWMCVLHQSWYH